MSDRHREGGRLTREQIAAQLDMHPNTVDRIRKRFAQEGEEPALNRKPPPLIPPRLRETPPKEGGWSR